MVHEISSPEARLRDLGFALPSPAAPVASYAAVVLHGGLAFVSGQLPRTEHGLIKGVLSSGDDLAAAVAAARLCAVSVLAVLNQALGDDLGRVERCLQLAGFVAATPEFEGHSQVVNGASDLMLEVFGDAGRHARAAVGVASLPFGVGVEISAVFAVG